MAKNTPWDASYRAVGKVVPSWAKHGVPALFQEFVALRSLDGRSRQHLDIGSGNGIKTVVFAENGLEVIGLDPSGEAVIQARALAKRRRLVRSCQFLQANALNIPLPDNSIGSASDILVSTHFTSTDLKKYIRELDRVLVAGGYFLAVFFSDQDLHFHGWRVHGKKNVYTYNVSGADPNLEPALADFAHYNGMVNFHFGPADVDKVFGRYFRTVKMREVRHPVYAHRKLLNVIMQKPIHGS